MTLALVRTEWSGLSGGPGLTQLAVSAGGGGSFTQSNAEDAVADVAAFFASLVSGIPDEVTLTVSPTVDVYDHVTGMLTDSMVVATPPVSTPGTNASEWVAGVGLRFDWNTGAIYNGKRVVGHTYIVPATPNVFGLDGRVEPAYIEGWTAAGQQLITDLAADGLNLVVWSRPSYKGATDGRMTAVSTCSMTGKSAFWRPRRD